MKEGAEELGFGVSATGRRKLSFSEDELMTKELAGGTMEILEYEFLSSSIGQFHVSNFCGESDSGGRFLG